MRYRVTKTIEVAGAHRLALPYESACGNLHGHNWLVSVTCESDKLDANGMVLDFTAISRIVKRLDHVNLNDLVEQPTAENIGRWLLDQIPLAVSVTVQESAGNVAEVHRV